MVQVSVLEALGKQVCRYRRRYAGTEEGMQNSHSFLINQLEKLLSTLALLPGKILEPNPAANPMLNHF